VRRRGTVVDFDDERGLGTVRDDDGTTHPFHCTAIADGSRHVDVGAVVEYSLVAGRVGRHEADGLTSA
jgi:cold shock CspA family protein